MRIRSTKPEFWRSERIASVCWEDRLLLKGLESYVDDNGVGKDDIALIVGDLFQRDLVLDASGTLRKVQEGLSRLNQAGLLWRYTHEGTPLIFVSFWETAQYVQKPLKGRNPRPDGTYGYKESVIGESPPEASGSLRNLPALNRGTGEQGTGKQGGDRGETPPPTPFCSRHPEGTDEPCSGCKKARIEWDKLNAPVKPVAPDYRNTTQHCADHPGYPLPCDRCRRDAEDAA